MTDDREPTEDELDAIDVDYDRMFHDRVLAHPVANAKLLDRAQAQEAFDRFARIMTELGAVDEDWSKMMWVETAERNPDLDNNEITLLVLHQMTIYDL